jgi:Glycosyltransferase
MSLENKKFTIVMIVASLPPMQVGGAESQALKLAKKLKDLGHKIIFITPGSRLVTKKNRISEFEVYYLNSIFNKIFSSLAKLKKFKPKKAVQIEFDDSNSTNDEISSKVGIPTIIYYLIFYYHSLTLLKKKNFSIDIIHSHTMEWSAIVATKLGYKLKKPVLIKDSTMNGFWSLKRYPYGEQKQNFIRHTAYFIAMTNAIEENLLLNGISSNKIHRIPNGIEIDVTDNIMPIQSYKVLFVGNLYQQPAKGIDILLKSWKLICKNFETAELHLVGHGNTQQYQEFVHNMGISKNVIIHGKQNDIKQYYRKCFLFVLPSRREGMSNSLMEAMLHSMPCIATNISGNQDLIEDGINGLLVPPKNIEALADAIVSLFNDPEKAIQLGEKARETIINKYSIDKIALLYSELYRELGNKV